MLPGELGNLSIQSGVLPSDSLDFFRFLGESGLTAQLAASLGGTRCSSWAFSPRCRLLSAVRELIDVALRSLCWPAGNKCAASSTSSAVSCLMCEFCVLISVSRSLIFPADSCLPISIPSSRPFFLAFAVRSARVLLLTLISGSRFTRRVSREGDGSTPSEASPSSLSSEAGRSEILGTWNRDNQMDLSVEPSSQPTGENQFILFQRNCRFGWTRNWIPPRQLGRSPRKPEWPSEPRTPTKPQNKYTYTLIQPQKGSNFLRPAEFHSVGNTQDIFETPIRKIQGCVSPYLVQSGRPAGPKFRKSEIRANNLLEFYCRVSFEFLLAVSGIPKWKHRVNV